MLLPAKLGFPGEAKNLRYASTVTAFDPVIEIFETPAESPGEGPADTTLAGAHEADQYNRPDIVRTPLLLAQVSLLFIVFRSVF